MLIKLFAAARQFANADAIEIPSTESLTLADLQKSVIEKYPALAQIIQQSRWAIDGQYASLADCVKVDSELALIPPVSGG